jgi:hypothetical protein
MSWYDPLRTIASLGSLANRPGSLAGLAPARREHLGQFFTPDDLAALMWRLVTPAMNAALQESPGSKIALLDNSVGSGRLLQYADSEKHSLYGADIHHATISALCEVTHAAGFESEFVPSGMEEIRPKHINVALINPPFSIHIESPCLKPYACTTWGKYGPNTSTRSDLYAVAQALDSSEVVVAILPVGAAQEIAGSEWASPRLVASFDLPSGCFREEGTDVAVKLLVFGKENRGRMAVDLKVASFSDLVPSLQLSCSATGNQAKLGTIHGEASEPAITLPVTGDNTVRVTRDGRRLKLHFYCGLVQAEVMNAVYRDRIETVAVPEHRYPKGTRYNGQGVLDIEAHLAQPDPQASFQDFFNLICDAGGKPVAAPGLLEFFKKKIHRSKRQATPLAHVVYDPHGGSSDVIMGTARKTHLVDPKTWGSPAIKAGAEIAFTRTAGNSFTYTVGSRQYSANLDELGKRFGLESSESAGWVQKYPGLLVEFPALAHQLRRRAERLGIDKWLWDYQFDDLIEFLLKPEGSVCGWEMACGKARLAIAMILLSGCKTGLIAVEAYLIDEMIVELEGLPIDQDIWQVIRSEETARNLKTINLISYNRLRSPIDPARPKYTYGKALRRKVGILIADEGHLLRNADSQQSQALWAVSAKRRYALTGTPIANYPRDILPILAFTGGDGTAAQPWGYRRAFMDQILRNSMQHAQRGIDAFKTEFVTLEWCTNEFSEDLKSGAKREVPKIANLDAYRKAIAPHVKRRLVKEPDVAKFVNIKDPIEQKLIVPWDDAHLLYYIATAEDFASWYMDLRSRSGLKGNNLIAILARIQAVHFAANYPQQPREGQSPFWGLTSKQRAAVDKLEELTLRGHKTIFYAHNPGLVELISRELTKRGIDNMTLHGGKPITARTKELNSRFRFGDCPNLLASLGCVQAGLNLWQADRGLFYDRDWAAKTEMQALRRMLRPQQRREVVAYYMELPGSIDSYQDQMVSFKKTTAVAGLDWGTPDNDDVEFLHLDTILGRFCKDIAEMRGVERHKLRQHLEQEIYLEAA